VIPLPAPDVTWFDVLGETRVGRAGDGVVVEWPGFLRMTASPAMDSAHVEVLGDLDQDIVTKAGGFARALPAYLRGGIVFHAAAVSVGDRALLVLGDSGAGKSTTAALLCDHGASLIADDTALGRLEGDALWLQPLEDTHWLDEAARRALARADASLGKRPVAGTASRAPARLAAVVVLEAGATIAITPLHGLACAGALLKSALRLPLDATRSKEDLDRLARVARTVPFFRVLRPREFSSNLKELPSLLLRLFTP